MKADGSRQRRIVGTTISSPKVQNEFQINQFQAQRDSPSRRIEFRVEEPVA